MPAKLGRVFMAVSPSDWMSTLIVQRKKYSRVKRWAAIPRPSRHLDDVSSTYVRGFLAREINLIFGRIGCLGPLAQQNSVDRDPRGGPGGLSNAIRHPDQNAVLGFESVKECRSAG